LLDRKAEILPFLQERPAATIRPTPDPQPFVDDAREVVTRPFLPRPLGQEAALDPWEVWQTLFDWLIEHHPEHFHAVCDAEDELNRMERQGITSGDAYEAACRDLYVKFEAARRLKLKAEVKTWLQ
jgi:hypothetical protein